MQRVDDENRRRARRDDEHAREHRPGDLRQLVRARQDGVHAPRPPLVLAATSGTISRDGPIRRAERPHGERRCENRRERQVPVAVEDRDHEHDRPARRVADQHRPLRAELRDHRPRRDAEERDRQHLAAITHPIFAVDPVVARTNHGRATNVIDEPVSETSSAAIKPRSERFFNIARQNNTYVRFCQGTSIRPMPKVSRGASRRAEGPDPRRRAPRVREVRLRRRDGRPPRGGDRPVARRDLPLLREQEGSLRRPRDGDEHALRRRPRRVRARRRVPRAHERKTPSGSRC